MSKQNIIRLKSAAVGLPTLLLFALFVPGVCTAQSEPRKGVLLLFPTDSIQVADLEIFRGIQSVLGENSSYPVSAYMEYVGPQPFAADSYQAIHAEWLREKYKGRRVDLIVAGGPVAAPTAVNLRAKIWPGIPIVIYGDDQKTVDQMNLGPGIVGISTDVDIAGTLTAALRLLPETQHVVVVNGASAHERLLRTQFDKAMEAHRERLDVIDLTGLTKEELKTRLGSSPENSIVLYLNLTADRTGKTYVSLDVAKELIPFSNVPVFSVRRIWLGNGMVGGVLFDWHDAGREVGELVLSVLRGEPPNPLPRTGQNTLIWDWRQLKKWNINEKNVTPDAVVLFREPSGWEKYRWQIIGVIALSLLQLLLIAGLLDAQVKSRRLQRVLAERLRFETLLSDLSVGFANLDVQEIDQQIETSLRRLTEFLGVDRCMLWELSGDGQALSLTHCYEVPGLPPPPAFPGDVPWIAKQFAGGKTVTVTRPGDLPSEAIGERKYFEHSGLKSLLAIPLTREASIQSILSFNSYRSYREWPQDLVDRLRVVGDIFASAVAHRRAEDKLSQLRLELFRMNRVATMGEFGASIAHEVNQPLCAMVAGADACRRWLNSEPQDLEEARASLDVIVEGGQRAREVVDHIRSLLKSGKPEMAELDPNEVIKSVVTLMRSSVVGRGITLRTELADNLPAVLADEVQLYQVLVNLLINGAEAIRVSGNETRELTVVSGVDENGDVKVEVRDTGTGIDLKEMDNIFNAFYTTKPEGMGMGLSINRTIITAHGGRLWARSNEGPGATFCFSIPAHSESEA